MGVIWIRLFLEFIDVCILYYCDDGKGLLVDEVNMGFGLVYIKDWVVLFGGIFDYYLVDFGGGCFWFVFFVFIVLWSRWISFVVEWIFSFLNRFFWWVCMVCRLMNSWFVIFWLFRLCRIVLVIFCFWEVRLLNWVKVFWKIGFWGCFGIWMCGLRYNLFWSRVLKACSSLVLVVFFRR